VIGKFESGVGDFLKPSFEGMRQVRRDREVIDEEFGVGIGEVCGGYREWFAEGFQQGLEDRIGLPALGDGLVEIAEDAEGEGGTLNIELRTLNVEVKRKNSLRRDKGKWTPRGRVALPLEEAACGGEAGSAGRGALPDPRNFESHRIRTAAGIPNPSCKERIMPRLSGRL
jgi:hypothetical protein